MTIAEKKNPVDVFIFLPILAVCVDLLTPYLIWKNILPPEIRWVSHIALVGMVLVSLVRMLGFDLIPLSFWMIAFISVFWSIIAIGNGQGITPTVWGVWLLFQFPFVSLFMYLDPEPPQRLLEYLRTFCLVALGMELIAQLLQFAFGVTPGDDLAGLFGRNGTDIAVLFGILVCCMFFGHWIMTKKWRGLLIALSMAMISSVLGEMKLFPVAITFIGLMAIFLYAIKYRALGKMFQYLLLILIILVGFVFLYNRFVPGASEIPLQTYITDLTKFSNYINFENNSDNYYYTDIGRGTAVSIGWNSLQKNPFTLLVGYGIGTRSESISLGTAGVAIALGSVGPNVGTSLLVMMQEMGVIGLALLTCFLAWILLALWHDIRAYPESPAIGLRYALILFSILWPLWLWYATTWTMRVPMLLYWFSLGYTLAETRIARHKTQVYSRVTNLA